MPTLTIREPGRVAVRVPVSDGDTVGRDPACSVVLHHRSVSRRHAKLTVDGDGMRVADLGSMHGIKVRGERVEHHHLSSGESIHLGMVLIEYSDRDETSIADELTIHPSSPPPVSAEISEADKRLAILYDLARAIGSLGDLDELVGRILQAALDALRCERGVVELVGDTPRRISRGAASEDLVMSRTVLDALTVRHERVLVEARSKITQSMVRAGVRAAMGVPLASAQGPLGFIYVDDRTRADRFSVDELDFLTAVAHLMAAALEQSRERRRLEMLLENTREVVETELVGASEPMQKLRKETQRYATARDTAVLVRGESGTGKELVARTLHGLSPRAAAPFVAVNCAAIPDTMIESELFGHERGAFTGAVKAMRGKFALADGGTLFLDEVGDLTLPAQAKLLRALENGEVRPLGSERVLEVDVRVVSATHKQLEQEIAAGRFREDLFYRLAVGQINVPPLRGRGEDVVQLAEMFRERYASQLGKRMTGFGPVALDTLRRHPWPGNVRQLRNEIERAVILSDGNIIDELGVGVPALAGAPPPAPAPAADAGGAAGVPTLEEAERRHIENALREHDGNIFATAKAIGVSRGLLYRKIAKYGIKV